LLQAFTNEIIKQCCSISAQELLPIKLIKGMSALFSPVSLNIFQKLSDGVDWQRTDLERTWQDMWTHSGLSEVSVCLQILASTEKLWFS